MTPGVLFLGCTVATAIAAAVDVAAHRRRARGLRSLATEWRMNYHPADQLRLTPKVLQRFPIPGAANVRVVDLIYGSERDRYRYVFSVEFTIGLVGPKSRVVRVASLSEPRDRGGAGPVSLTLAPQEGTLLEQYRYLAPPASAQTKTAGGGESEGLSTPPAGV
jgi:hypothetical protein